MRTHTTLVVLLVVTVALSGCSFLGGSDSPESTVTAEPTQTELDTTATQTPTGESEFSTSVTFPTGGVVGEPLVVEVQVENTGDRSGEYGANLTAAGEVLASEEVTVASGESDTLVLEHTPGASGIFDATVAGETRTLTVYDDELQFVDAAMQTVDTHRRQRIVNESGQLDLGDGPQPYEKNAVATIDRDFVDGTYYERTNATLEVGSATLEETNEQWVRDGILYERKIKHTEETTEYDRRPSGKPYETSALDIHGTPTEAFMRTEHTAEEYVFVFDPQSSEGASALMARVIGEGGLLPSETVTSARLELRYDRQTGRETAVTQEIVIDGAETFPELDRTVELTTVAYGVPVTVEVPDDVRENTS